MRQEWEQRAAEMDAQYGFEPGQMNRLITAESGWNPNVVSPKGAFGLSQFMPDTAAEWGVTDDPMNQIEKGAAYLSHLRQRYGGDMRKAIAAYNWGMGNLEKKGMQNMPAETRNYLAKVHGGGQALAVPQPAMAPAQPPQPVLGQAMLQPPPISPERQQAIAAYQQEVGRQEEKPGFSLASFIGDLAPSFYEAAGLPNSARLLTEARMQQRREDRMRRQENRARRLEQLRMSAFPELGGGPVGQDATAKMKDFMFRQGLSPEQQAIWDASQGRRDQFKVVTDPNTGTTYRINVAKGSMDPLFEGPSATEAAQADIERKGVEQAQKQFIAEQPELENTLLMAEPEMAKINELSGLIDEVGITPLNAVTQFWNRDAAKLMAQFNEIANSEVLRRLAMVGGSDTEKEYQWMREIVGNPTDMNPEKALEFIRRSKNFIEQTSEIARTKLSSGYERFGIPPMEGFVTPGQREQNQAALDTRTQDVLNRNAELIGAEESQRIVGIAPVLGAALAASPQQAPPAPPGFDAELAEDLGEILGDLSPQDRMALGVIDPAIEQQRAASEENVSRMRSDRRY